MANQIQLLKWRVSDITEIANALYINDVAFLAGSDIDAKLKALNEATVSSFCYKVQGLNGSLIGFFCVPKDKQVKKLNAFYVKPEARTSQYLREFWNHVSYTLFGEVYESINPFNYVDFASLLVSSVELPVPDKYYGINYILNS